MTLPAFISPATEPDIPALLTLVNGAYRGESARMGWTTEADLLDGLRTDAQSLLSMIQNPEATLLLYKQEGQLRGCVYVEARHTELYLGMLTVAPDQQANGIGKQLMAVAEQVARAKQCQAITITVITVRHELIAWYERRGFQMTGETQPFPNDPRFGIPKQPLSFCVMKKRLYSDS